MSDHNTALAILNRATSMFARDGEIEIGSHLRGTETLTLNLAMSDKGHGRLSIIGPKETGPNKTTMLKLFEAAWTQTTAPKVTTFERGAWERELLALDS